MKLKTPISLIVLAMFVSCSKNNGLILHPNAGTYKLISLVSNTSLDLNFDNIKSIDFQRELNVYFNDPFAPSYDLQIKDPIYDDENKLYFRLDLPSHLYHPDTQILRNFFGSGDYSKSIIVDGDKFVSITHHLWDSSETPAQEIIDGNYPYPYHLEFNSDIKVTVYVKQNFFDLEKDEWVLVELVGVFEKVLESDTTN